MSKAIFAIVCTLCLISLAPSPAPAASHNLTFAHFAPPQHIQHSGVIEPWAKEIGRLTNNNVAVNVSHSSEKGAPPELFAALQIGIIDMVWLPMVYIPDADNMFPMTSFLRLPFFFDTSEKGSVLFWRIYEQYLKDEFKDFKVLWMFAMSPSPISTIKKPVLKLEDMKGLKLSLGTGWIFKDTLQMVGADLNVATVNETAQILELNLADGVLLPFEVIPPFQMNKHLKYYTIAHMFSEPMFALMNKKKFDALPSDIKQAIDGSIGEKMSRSAGRNFDQMDKAMMELCINDGGTVNELSESEKNRFKEATQSIYSVWVQKMEAMGLPGKQLLDSAQKILADMN